MTLWTITLRDSNGNRWTQTYSDCTSFADAEAKAIHGLDHTWPKWQTWNEIISIECEQA
jgi:hypothetical protein